MTPYLVEVQNELKAGATETKQYIYDLYAVSNHYGSMNGGHYTAYCINPVHDLWFEFDDEAVGCLSKSNNYETIKLPRSIY